MKKKTFISLTKKHLNSPEFLSLFHSVDLKNVEEPGYFFQIFPFFCEIASASQNYKIFCMDNQLITLQQSVSTSYLTFYNPKRTWHAIRSLAYILKCFKYHFNAYFHDLLDYYDAQIPDNVPV